MMNFRIVKNQIVKILGDASMGNYQVVGYQVQSKSSDQIKDRNRTVQVYFADGNFPKSSGRMRGHKTHDITIEIDLSASSAAKGDLSVLESETSTADQRAVALSAVRDAAEVADKIIDELIDIVYQILMDARNEGLNLETGIVSSRWIDRIQKDTIIESGDLIVKTANMKYTCRVQEDVDGSLGNEPETVIFDSDIKIGDSEGAGVNVINDNT